MDLLALIAAAADVCRKPLRHGVVPVGADDAEPQTIHLDDLRLRLEARDPDGARQQLHDLELEIYRSGADLNLMLGWWDQPDRPLLWQGQHPVWMDGSSGQRCTAPSDGAPIEALARRLRALLVGSLAQEGG
ncbi:hypothetical protein CWE17_05665 [Synechococcus sp. BS56D]|uniref:hypothetical protein n=1 Tax=Synechococcus sp. BS56D TaxID=2055944 RepID=UPI00103CB7F4|nr:hypothetical protein [Synechococcus sp. BS56D]TCD58570.1 hypothetical protein CWE17_05665 [Synechococcus sp. BS56D]